MVSRMLRSFGRVTMLVGTVGLTLTASALAKPLPGVRTARPTRGFALFAGTPAINYEVNRVQCGIINNGTNCVDPTGSPVNENGFWPRGTSFNYVFNSGLQIAGFIPGTKTATFPWPGDTIGAFFFDPRGDQHHGEGVTNIFDGGSTADLAAWPSAAMVNDTGLYSAALIGRQTLSQEDLWVRYWDGNTSLATGRKHTMGLLVDQRILGWNFPAGNQDIIYVIVRFINITSGTRTDYDGLSAYGYTSSDIDDIYAVAQNYRATSQAFYNVQIPAGGFAWTNVYASYAEDPDVGDATSNYSVGNLIFNTVYAYKSNFSEPTWALPPSIFSAPFGNAPGFMGIKYLKTPGNLGITMSGNTTNGGAFPDAVGVSRLWRNLSGNLLATDGTCNVTPPIARRQCYWAQAPADTRMFAASGPFTINPGQAATIAAALVWAAPVATLAAATPGVNVAANKTISAYSLSTYINGNMVPGFAIDPQRLHDNVDTVRVVDRATGFINYANPNGDTLITQNEVTTVPRSLLGKELVAQAVFDSKFLLPFAPDAPQFFLVPGDDQVTVAWQPSSSEATGNPFFAVASLPLNGANPNPLYDPNFRKFDVEGYRIWRGRTASEMAVVASFDYAGTSFVDYTAIIVDPNTYGNKCAPEIGVTGTCPAGHTYALAADGATYVTASPISFDIAGNLQQTPPGGRVQLADGSVFNLSIDTAVVGGASGLPALTDNGVPFAFVDNGVLNGVRYFYAVTAFMVNSVKSGPSSLESPLVTKTVTPRVGSGAETPGTATLTLTGRGTTALDPTAPLPGIDATTGIFSGPMPPTNGLSIGFASFLPYAASGSVAIQIDSIIPSLDCNPGVGGTCTTGAYWVTITRPDSVVKKSLPFVLEGTTGPSASLVYQYPPIPFLTALAGRFGGDSTYSLTAQATLSFPGNWSLQNQGRGAANSFPTSSTHQYNGPRWWAGSANETLANPNGNTCPSPGSTCLDTVGNATASAGGLTTKTAGVLPSISALFPISSYATVPNPMRALELITSSVTRAADFNVYWGATAGKVDSVIDVTHNVTVPFSSKIRASWGILNDSSLTNTPLADIPSGSNALLTWGDVFCVDPVETYISGDCGTATAAQAAFLMDHVVLGPVSAKASSFPDGALVTQGATGQGFIFYLNGKFFMMQVATTLAACCQNTVWHARFYAGGITGTPGSFAFVGATRPPAVPGLKLQIAFTSSSFNTAVSNDSLMARIHTVPDPYYVTNSLEQTVNTKILRFVNLPAQAIIRIYSASGVLVNIITHNDPGGSGEQVWDLRNRNQQFVASGVYFYHVEGPDGKTKIGRFTVVNYAQ